MEGEESPGIVGTAARRARRAWHRPPVGVLSGVGYDSRARFQTANRLLLLEPTMTTTANLLHNKAYYTLNYIPTR